MLKKLKNLIKNSPFDGRVYLVGGSVRDMAMGFPPKDYDLVVEGDIEDGIKFAVWAAKYTNTYKEDSNPVVFKNYGTAKFVFEGHDIEVVATRKEKYNKDSRKPEVVRGTLAEDIFRRDFSINSLYYDFDKENIIDLTGNGLKDIQNKIIRATSDPEIIFDEDPLRMLRAIKFACRYNFAIEENTYQNIKKFAPKLQKISKERIQNEFNQILVSNNVISGMLNLLETGLLFQFIPEFEKAVGMVQNDHHIDDVFWHTLSVLSKAPNNLVTRLIALFHDIGKTETKTITETGIHFYNHEEVGAEMTKNILRRLKYPNFIVDDVVFGVEHHMDLKYTGDDGKITDKSLRKFVVKCGDLLENILDVMDADNKSHKPSSNMPNQIPIIREKIKNLTMPVEKVILPINGRDLLHLGYKQGPEIGKILKKIEELWYQNPQISKEECLEIAKNEKP